MGGIGKAIGGAFDPMTGRFNPAGLFVPQVREDFQRKRTMMEEEVKTDQTRRRALQFARNQDVLQTAEKTGKPVSKGQLLAMRRETVLSAGGGQEGRIEARASGLGRGDIRAKLEDYDESQRKVLAGQAAFRDIAKKAGYTNVDGLIDMWGPEELKQAGVTEFAHLESVSGQMAVLGKQLANAKSEADYRDTLNRGFQDHMTGVMATRDLAKAATRHEEFLGKEHAQHLDKVEDFDWFMKKEHARRRSKRFGQKNDTKDLTNADLQTVRRDLTMSMAEADPEAVSTSADGSLQPKLSAVNAVNRTSYLVEELVRQGATSAAASAAGRFALMSQMKRGPMSLPSPLKPRSRIFNNFLAGGVGLGSGTTGKYAVSEEDLATTATALNQRFEELRLMRADAVTKKYADSAVPLDKNPEAFFLTIDRAMAEAGIPAEIRRDPDGHVKFMPKEGFGQSGVPPEYLDQLTQILMDFIDRDAETAAPERSRRVKAR